VLSNKSTLIGVAVPTPTRKDGTPIPLAETPPEGFQKVRVPSVTPPPELPPPPADAAPSEAPKPEPRVLTQEAIDAIKSTSTPTDPEKVNASTRVTRRDLPVQGARRSVPVAASSGVSSSSRLLALSAALAVLVLGGRWFFQQRHVAEDEHVAAAPPPTEVQGVQVVPPAADKPAPTAAPSAASAVPATEPAPVAAAAPEASASAEASADAAAPASSAPLSGTRVVIVKLSPPGARLFRKGKPVPGKPAPGGSTVTIELPPDEKKRAFEVGMPGYETRKLVVDGSKSEIYIGLKPR
jgi:hypothetical protein